MDHSLNPTAVKIAVIEGLQGAIKYLHARSIMYSNDPALARQQSLIDGAAADRIRELVQAELERN